MDAKARTRAIKAINRIFAAYRAAQPTDPAMLAALTNGKLYELYVLSQVVTDLSHRGFRLRFVGSKAPKGVKAVTHSTLKFKASPGKIKASDSHFEVSGRYSIRADYRIFLNIEFDTLGHHHTPATDNSRRHELDIIVTTATSGYPTHHEILLGVECNAVANFHKGLIKEALGVRREMSLLKPPTDSLLTRAGGQPAKQVAADPASEFLVFFIDPKGNSYADSPRVFGIEFVHRQP